MRPQTLKGIMKEMQFSAVVMTTLMALALVFMLPTKVHEDRVANRSRWLMTGGLVLIGVQFLIQYLSGMRTSNMTHAVMVNLVHFIPAAVLMSLNVINLERQGRIKRIEWIIGAATWVVATVLVLCKSLVAASVIYGIMQIYYSYLQLHELSRLEFLLDDYYDDGRQGLLWWMKLTIVILSFTTVMVPLMIFSQDWLLTSFALVLFIGIFYMWFCFVRYVVSGASSHLQEAEQSAEQEQHEISATAESLQRVEKAVEKWTAAGGHLHSGTTKPMAAQEMKLPQYLLSAWIKAQGYASYSKWITTLRVEEAKNTISAHPEWSNEAVADHCGISRSHFQRVFLEITGVTPTQFQKN